MTNRQVAARIVMDKLMEAYLAAREDRIPEELVLRYSGKRYIKQATMDKVTGHIMSITDPMLTRAAKLSKQQELLEEIL